MVACDFFVVITAAFRTLYVFLVMEIGSRRILHYNVSAPPPAEWTLQQFRKRCRAIIPIASSSTIAIASSLSKSTRVWRTWVYGFYGRRCEHRRRTRCASDWAGAFVATVSTG
jgi:hypothetical protein